MSPLEQRDCRQQIDAHPEKSLLMIQLRLREAKSLPQFAQQLTSKFNKWLGPGLSVQRPLLSHFALSPWLALMKESCLPFPHPCL